MAMQVFYFLKDDLVIERQIAPAGASAVPGVLWGRPDVLFTPAYWLTQYWMREDTFSDRCHRLGRTFEEEVVACLLGGHGIPAEVGLAAFERLRDWGIIADPPASAEVVSEALRVPLEIRGRRTIYRFWSQKAKYVSGTLSALRSQPAPTESARALREYLTELPGIGPKTASWIVRNWLGASDVAILDVHVVRAGQLMGLFHGGDRVEQHYRRMEQRFLELADAMEVPAANLDSLIWQSMRNSPRLVAGLFSSLSEPAESPSPVSAGRRQSKQVQLRLV